MGEFPLVARQLASYNQPREDHAAATACQGRISPSVASGYVSTLEAIHACGADIPVCHFCFFCNTLAECSSVVSCRLKMPLAPSAGVWSGGVSR